MFDIIQSFFEFIFSWNSYIALIINLIIISISTISLIIIIYKMLIIRGAYNKFTRLKENYLSLENDLLSKEKIKELVREPTYYHPWIENKFETVFRLQSDTNAIIDSIDNIDSSLRWKTYGILKFPISSLIIFGLLGTIAGLQQAIHHFLPAIESGSTLNLDSVRAIMLGTMQGMQTAFSTTLAGLFCSIILGFLVSMFLRGYFDRYITSIKNFLVEEIIPLYTVLDDTNVERLVNQSEKLESAVRSIAEQSNILFRPIVESANKMDKGLKQIYKAAHTFIPVTEEIKSFTNTLKGSLTTLGSSLDNTRMSIDKYNNIQTEMETTIKDIANVPEQFKNYIKELKKEFNEHYTKALNLYNDNTKNQLETLIEASKSMTDQMNTWKEATSETREAFKDAAKKGVGDLIDDVKKLLDEVNNTSSNVAEINSKISESFLKAQQSQKDFAEQYLNTYKKQYEDIHNLLNNFLEKSKKNQDNRNKQVLDAISSWVTYNQFLSKLLNQMDSLPRRIADVVNDNNGKHNKST